MPVAAVKTSFQQARRLDEKLSTPQDGLLSSTTKRGESAALSYFLSSPRAGHGEVAKSKTRLQTCPSNRDKINRYPASILGLAGAKSAPEDRDKIAVPSWMIPKIEQRNGLPQRTADHDGRKGPAIAIDCKVIYRSQRNDGLRVAKCFIANRAWVGRSILGKRQISSWSYSQCPAKPAYESSPPPSASGA